MSKKVFVDTSAWVALLNKSDQYFQDAMKVYSDLAAVKLFVSNFVVGETYTWLRYKASYDIAFSFLKSTYKKAELGQAEIIYADSSLEQSALHLLERYKDQRISFTDALSFSIMDKLKINDAFAYDLHFSIAGFNLINKI